jgi:hypothetical protein
MNWPDLHDPVIVAIVSIVATLAAVWVGFLVLSASSAWRARKWAALSAWWARKPAEAAPVAAVVEAAVSSRLSNAQAQINVLERRLALLEGVVRIHSVQAAPAPAPAPVPVSTAAEVHP